MSTSFVYHAFGIRGYDYVRTEYTCGKIIFTIEHKLGHLRCPVCRSRKLTLRGKKQREYRCVPIGKKPVLIKLALQRVFCLVCQIVRQVNSGFADPLRSYTKAFERYALDLSKHMTIKDVAIHLGVSWEVIKDIQKRSLQKRFARLKLKHLKEIAIDEISIGKRHRYFTIVLDLATGAVVFVGDGKGSDALIPFWRKLKASRAKVKAVAMDMSPAYISALIENLPKAKIVFDHFHVIKLYNERLSNLRRDLYRHAQNQMEKDVLKGTRWLLLKNPENLDNAKNEKQRLEEALDLNKPLATAYYMKEDLRQLWAQPDKETAERFLQDWVQRARASAISMLMRFANTLLAHRTGILAYYDFPISTGPLEGTNNKIKTMKRQAYGFRDKLFFKLKIMAIHEAKYALVG